MAGERLGQFPNEGRASTLPHDEYRAERERYNSGGKVHRVAIAADHGGFTLKELLRRFLEGEGYRVQDLGPYDEEKVDYPDYAAAVARAVSREDADRGIMIDAAGIGSSMVCNKVHGVRAALCYNRETVENSRLHNNANVLTLGARFHEPDEACELVSIWLQTKFEGGRHWPRINKMMAVERGRND